MLRKLFVAAVVAVAGSVTLFGQVPLTQQARDSQAKEQVPATALIMGTVVTGGAGQPADGVRLTMSGSALRGSRSTLTDDNGNFAFLALPPGTYTLRATKPGHVSATYGQKAPGRPGTPIVLAEGQQLKSISLELPKGGVISGIVYDEKNRPSVSTSVRAMRWTMQSGERVLSSAGTATTDDRGMYRIFGLVPGDYVVSATARNSSTNVINMADLQNLERMEELASLGLVGGNMTITGNVSISSNQIEVLTRDMATPNGPTVPVSGYAPVYFPGTPLPDTAQAIQVGAAQEQLGIDFQLQRVPLTMVTGQIIVPNGITVTSVQVRLRNQSISAPGTQQFSARPDRNGLFKFNAVPPGQYVMSATVNAPVARAPATVPTNPAAQAMQERLVLASSSSSGGRPRLWATADVSVDGGFAPNVTLSLQDGVNVSGSLAFQGSAPRPPQLNRVRLTLTPHGRAMQSLGLSTVNVTADVEGRFAFKGIVPGQYRIRASGASGWTLKSAMADGRDALDFWIEIGTGQQTPNISLTFGDQSTSLKGVLQNHLGQPTADYTVIVFPADNRYWVPLARRVRSARPATDGSFSFMGLPEGEYRLATVTDVESGAWYDPALLEQLQVASVPVRLADGQPVVQDLRVSR